MVINLDQPNNTTLKCSDIKFNYKQCRNLVADGALTAQWGAWNVMENFSLQTIEITGINLVDYFKINNLFSNTYLLATNVGKGITNMLSQDCFMIQKGHTYYGGCIYSYSNGKDSTSADDDRFELCNLTAPESFFKMTFGRKIPTSGTYEKISSIYTVPNNANLASSYGIRNFWVGAGKYVDSESGQYQYNSEAEAKLGRMIIIDLVEADLVAEGQLLSTAELNDLKNWCDSNILEWSKIYLSSDYGNEEDSQYKKGGLITRTPYPSDKESRAPCGDLYYSGVDIRLNYSGHIFANHNATNHSRDVFYEINQSTLPSSDTESFLINQTGTPYSYIYPATVPIHKNHAYYTWCDEEQHRTSDKFGCYFPNPSTYGEDANMGVEAGVLWDNRCSGGAMCQWNRTSLLAFRKDWEETDCIIRWDLDCTGDRGYRDIANWGIIICRDEEGHPIGLDLWIKALLFCLSKSYNHGNPAAIGLEYSNFNKYTYDRYFGGYSLGLIHVCDLNKKNIVFKNNSIIECNDIRLDQIVYDGNIKNYSNHNNFWMNKDGILNCTLLLSNKYNQYPAQPTSSDPTWRNIWSDSDDYNKLGLRVWMTKYYNLVNGNKCRVKIQVKYKDNSKYTDYQIINPDSEISGSISAKADFEYKIKLISAENKLKVQIICTDITTRGYAGLRIIDQYY